MSGCSFSCYQLRRFLCGEASAAIQQATGVNVMGDYNQMRYQAAQVGVNLNPDYAINQQFDKLENRFTGRDAPKVRPTPSEKLVSSVQEFLALRDKTASKSPLGGAICLVHALLNWINPSTRTLGSQLLVLAVAEEQLVKGMTYKGYSLNEDLSNYLVSSLGEGANQAKVREALHSLVVGTNPHANYSFNPSAVVLAEDVGAEEGQPDGRTTGTYTIYFRSTGSDSARSVVMSANKNGVWKAREFSSLFSEVEPTPVAVNAADEL